MKAITVKQPYASAIAVGLKRYETRSWRTHHRGPLAIHAGSRFASKIDQEWLEFLPDLHLLPRRCIVCVVDVVDCVEITPELIAAQPRGELALGDWEPGRFAWEIGRVWQPYPMVAIRGQQGLWTVPADIVERITAGFTEEFASLMSFGGEA